MRMTLYDMRMLSLLSTITRGTFKTVIEHEIIFIKTEIIFGLILVYNRKQFYNVSSYTWTIY